MTDTPVLVAGQQRTLLLDGTEYTVRALTYGEQSAIIAAAAADPAPPEEMLDEALCAAAEQAARGDLAEAIRALQDETDTYRSLFAARPPELDAEGRIAWFRENAAQIQHADKALRPLLRKRAIAMDLFRADPACVELRNRDAAARRAAVLRRVAAGLVRIGARDVRLTEAEAAEIPAGYLDALFAAIDALTHAGPDAAKN